MVRVKLGVCVEIAPAGPRLFADQRVGRPRKLSFEPPREFFAHLLAERLAGSRVVDSHQPLQRSPHRRGKGFPGRDHVGPDGVSAALGNLDRPQRADRGRMRVEGDVRVPAVLVGPTVGGVDDVLHPGLGRPRQPPQRVDVGLAEAAGERELLRVVEVLLGEDQHQVLVERPRETARSASSSSGSRRSRPSTRAPRAPASGVIESVVVSIFRRRPPLPAPGPPRGRRGGRS